MTRGRWNGGSLLCALLMVACAPERSVSKQTPPAPKPTARVEPSSAPMPSAPIPSALMPSTTKRRMEVVETTPAAPFELAASAPRSVQRSPKGSLTKESIRRSINRRINTIRLCYEAGATHLAQCARIDTQFTIEADGKVGQASIVKSETNDTRVDACVLEAVRAFAFPPPEGGGQVVVSYPFDPDCAW